MQSFSGQEADRTCQVKVSLPAMMYIKKRFHEKSQTNSNLNVTAIFNPGAYEMEAKEALILLENKPIAVLRAYSFLSPHSNQSKTSQ